jgi:hypothetical protein
MLLHVEKGGWYAVACRKGRRKCCPLKAAPVLGTGPDLVPQSLLGVIRWSARKKGTHLAYEIDDANHQSVGCLVNSHQEAIVHYTQLREEGSVAPQGSLQLSVGLLSHLHVTSQLMSHVTSSPPTLDRQSGDMTATSCCLGTPI